MAEPDLDAADVRSEFSGANFGDQRLSARLMRMAGALARTPDKSFPQAFGAESELEAVYRFWNNERVSAEAILTPHVEATIERCRVAGGVWALHDSSEFLFKGEREGLGRMLDHIRGFLGHFCLAVEADSQRLPLGILGFETLYPDVPEKQDRAPLNERKLASRRTPRDEKMSSRWEALVAQVEGRVANRAKLVHVMDQEADDYALLAILAQGGRRFIVRVSPDRLLQRRGDKLAVRLMKERASLTREVQLSERKKDESKQNPARGARIATLDVRAAPVEVHRPQHAQTTVPMLRLHAVYVRERHPPAGQPRVEWMLLTTEAIETEEQVALVVDGYRSRWRIEELFKALKTGCAFEKRQLTTGAALKKALAFFLPIAWLLLTLRALGREAGDLPASALFPERLLTLLALLSERHEVAKHATMRDAMLAIAGLGGHLKRNGDPGWSTLGLGFQRLLEAERVWRLTQSATYDQS